MSWCSCSGLQAWLFPWSSISSKLRKKQATVSTSNLTYSHLQLLLRITGFLRTIIIHKLNQFYCPETLPFDIVFGGFVPRISRRALSILQCIGIFIVNFVRATSSTLRQWDRIENIAEVLRSFYARVKKQGRLRGWLAQQSQDPFVFVEMECIIYVRLHESDDKVKRYWTWKIVCFTTGWDSNGRVASVCVVTVIHTNICSILSGCVRQQKIECQNENFPTQHCLVATIPSTVAQAEFTTAADTRLSSGFPLGEYRIELVWYIFLVSGTQPRNVACATGLVGAQQVPLITSSFTCCGWRLLREVILFGSAAMKWMR